MAFESDLHGHLRSAWNAVKQNEMVMCSDILSKIGKEDVVEILNLQGKQLFRSFHAFRFFSYTIEELATYPYWELFDRDLKIEAAYAEEFVRILKSEVRETYRLDIPTHIVREIRSSKAHQLMVTPKFLSPLKDRRGRVVAFIHTYTARKLVEETGD